MLAIATLAAAAAAAFVWQPGLGSLFDDSVSYLVMAQAMSPWSTPSAAIASAYPLERFPPGFPVAVALVGGAYDWRIAHALVAACFAASVFLAGQYARDVTGLPVVGIAAALTLAVLPEAWLNLKGVLSEFPYLALSLATLIHYRRLQTDAGAGTGAWVALGALLAAVVLTRTIGVALVAAVAVSEALLWRRRRVAGRARRAGIALAIPVLATALWYLLRPAGADDSYLASGAGVVRGTLEHGPAWLAHAIGVNVSALAFSWLHALMIFWERPWQPGVILGAALGLLALAGTGWRASRGEPDGLYALFFLGILLLWPFPWHMYRLGLPIVPVLLAAGWWALHEILAQRIDPPRARLVAAGVALAPLVLCVPAVLFYVAQRAATPEEDPGDGYRRTHITEFYRIPLGPLAASIASRQIGVFRDMDQIRATTPPGSRVMGYLPDYVALLAEREGVVLPPTADAARLALEVRRRSPDYIYLTAMRLREEIAVGDDPLALAGPARDYTRTVWARQAAGGKLEAVLLKVDKDRLEATTRP
jgi:hypothetical protein